MYGICIYGVFKKLSAVFSKVMVFSGHSGFLQYSKTDIMEINIWNKELKYGQLNFLRDYTSCSTSDKSSTSQNPYLINAK